MEGVIEIVIRKRTWDFRRQIIKRYRINESKTKEEIKRSLNLRKISKFRRKS